MGYDCSEPGNVLETLRIEAGVSVKSIIGLTSIFGIATGFAVKDLASNWVGGLLLFVTRPFVPGDKIEMTRLEQSIVERIGWYATRAEQCANHISRPMAES